MNIIYKRKYALDIYTDIQLDIFSAQIFLKGKNLPEGLILTNFHPDYVSSYSKIIILWVI